MPTLSPAQQLDVLTRFRVPTETNRNETFWYEYQIAVTKNFSEPLYNQIVAILEDLAKTDLAIKQVAFDAALIKSGDSSFDWMANKVQLHLLGTELEAKLAQLLGVAIPLQGSTYQIHQSDNISF